MAIAESLPRDTLKGYEDFGHTALDVGYRSQSASLVDPNQETRCKIIPRMDIELHMICVELAARRLRVPQLRWPGGRAYLITGPSPEAQNTFENPRAVATQEVKFTAAGDRWEYRFPRHSVSWLEFEVEG